MAENYGPLITGLASALALGPIGKAATAFLSLYGSGAPGAGGPGGAPGPSPLNDAALQLKDAAQALWDAVAQMKPQGPQGPQGLGRKVLMVNGKLRDDEKNGQAPPSIQTEATSSR